MAYEFYVTVVGARQGAFKGESGQPAHADALAGVGFSYEVAVSGDAGANVRRGRRQHGVVTFTKPWGAASPQLFSALVAGEVLSSALFEFVRRDEQGQDQVFQTVLLSNAQVVRLHRHIDLDADGSAARELEDVTLTFQKIAIEDIVGKTVAVDDR